MSSFDDMVKDAFNKAFGSKNMKAVVEKAVRDEVNKYNLEITNAISGRVRQAIAGLGSDEKKDDNNTQENNI